MVADTDTMTALSEHQPDGSWSARAGARPTTWQLMLWRFLALVAYAMWGDVRGSKALTGYLRRHPVRGAGYLVAAWVGALLVIELVAVPATFLLEGLHLHPRGAADFGVTLLAVCGLCALSCAAGRWLRHIVAARVHRLRQDAR